MSMVWFGDTTPTADALVAVIFDAASEEITATTGSIDDECFYTSFDSTAGAAALTLPDGLAHGQLKKLQLRVDAGDVTVTITSPVNAASDTIVFADVGDNALLIWNEEDTHWRILETGNDADGTSQPAVS